MKKQIQLLGLSCSPRKNGNTDRLLDAFLKGAAEEGILTEKVCLASLRIQPCTQCDDCLRTGICSLQDDMRKLYPKLLETDALALASPIYFMAHCAQAKALIDRCQLFWVRTQVRKETLWPPDQPPRRAVFIAAGATHGPNVFAGAKITMKWFLKSLAMEYWDNLLFEGIDAKGAIQKHPTALQDASQLGRRLAQSYKIT